MFYFCHVFVYISAVLVQESNIFKAQMREHRSTHPNDWKSHARKLVVILIIYTEQMYSLHRC